MSGFTEELERAVAVAREAGALLKARFGMVQAVDHKGRFDLVTEADRAAERLIVGRLGDAYPTDDIEAEEGGGVRHGSDRTWLVDPLDGTTNYAHEYPVFSVSIALQAAGRLEVGVVYNPMLDEVYAGRRGGGVTLNGRARRVSTRGTLEGALLGTGFPYQMSDDPELNNVGPFARLVVKAHAIRRAGSAALAIASVAVGRADGFWERGLKAWDLAAGALLVEEAGGRISDYLGGPVDVHAGMLVASNGVIHAQLLEELEPVVDRLRTGSNPPSKGG